MVVYLREGHEAHVAASHSKVAGRPWEGLAAAAAAKGGVLRPAEPCSVYDVRYAVTGEAARCYRMHSGVACMRVQSSDYKQSFGTLPQAPWLLRAPYRCRSPSHLALLRPSARPPSLFHPSTRLPSFAPPRQAHRARA